jgi:long-chain fatty acid transport protein
MKRSISAALAGTSVAALTAVLATSASAGGFAIREQSVESQGASFAGSAAFGGLSSMYWNPAAAANKDGLNFDSNNPCWRASFCCILQRQRQYWKPGAGSG